MSSSGESFLDALLDFFSSAFAVFLSVFSLPFPGFFVFFPILTCDHRNSGLKAALLKLEYDINRLARQISTSAPVFQKIHGQSFLFSQIFMHSKYARSYNLTSGYVNEVMMSRLVPATRGAGMGTLSLQSPILIYPHGQPSTFLIATSIADAGDDERPSEMVT
nr:ADP,ATP carrier protein 1, mitochondrial-like [Ipomoea batatas]